ncbi:hypothetical protein BJ741DRAFT_593608 [Chytriomyces cf. hyalinus JEL632]|nr:hypothetical protein BJ741DRAFT_593608 [Chytriomyces cf. hyalinus JEL632]
MIRTGIRCVGRNAISISITGGAWRHTKPRLLSVSRDKVAGTAACVGVLGLATTISATVFGGTVSPVPIAVIAGVAVGALHERFPFVSAPPAADQPLVGNDTSNTTAKDNATSSSPSNLVSLKLDPSFASTTLLRLGVVCVGAKLSLASVATSAALCLPVVVPTIAATVVAAVGTAHVLGLHRDFAVLMAAGTAICGVTAISTVGPAIGAAKTHVAVAVANVVVFGMLGMILYPLLAHYLFFDDNEDKDSSLSPSTKAGLLLGVAIHDSSQVLGAAMSFRDTYGNDEGAFGMATVTKLTRNLLLVVAVPLLSLLHRSLDRGQSTVAISGNLKKPPLFPLFVLGFLGVAALRTLGDLFISSNPSLSDGVRAAWKDSYTFIGDMLGGKIFLGTAMAGVGLGTKVSMLRGVGWRPFFVGGVAACTASITGVLSIYVLSKMGRKEALHV